MKKRLVYFGGIIVTILDILFLMYITFYPVAASFKYQVIAFDMLLCVCFWIEFLYNMKKADDKKKYVKDNSLGILGMLPFNSIFMRAFRFIKLAQFIKIYVFIRDDEKVVANFLKKTYLDKAIACTIIFIILITILVWFVDAGITDFGTAIWYTFASMTSTGYGDVVPTTVSGRIVGIVAMIGGIMIFSLMTAIISSAYVSRLNRENREDLESKIDDLARNVDELNRKIDELNRKIE